MSVKDLHCALPSCISNHMRKTPLCISILLLCIAWRLSAEPFNLRNAQAEMFDQNTSLLIAETRHAQTTLDEIEARADWLPLVRSQFGYSYTSHTPLIRLNTYMENPLYPAAEDSLLPLRIDQRLSDRDRTELGIDVSIPIFTAFSRLHRYRAAEATIAAGAMRLPNLKNELSYRLGESYFTLEHALERVETQNTMIRHLREYAQEIESRYQAGLVEDYTFLESKARLAQARVDLQIGRGIVDSLRLSIRILMNDTENNYLPQPYSYEHLLRQSADPEEISLDFDRPALVAYRDRKRNLEHSRKAVLGRRFPRIYLSGGLRYANPGLDLGVNELMSYKVVNASMVWDIFDGRANWVRRTRLSYELDLLELEKKSKIEEWERNVSQTRIRLRNGNGLHDVAVVAHEAAQALVTERKNALNAGTISTAEYLDALALSAKAKLRVSEADLVRKKALLKLMYEAGREIRF